MRTGLAKKPAPNFAACFESDLNKAPRLTHEESQNARIGLEALGITRLLKRIPCIVFLEDDVLHAWLGNSTESPIEFPHGAIQQQLKLFRAKHGYSRSTNWFPAYLLLDQNNQRHLFFGTVLTRILHENLKHDTLWQEDWGSLLARYRIQNLAGYHAVNYANKQPEASNDKKCIMILDYDLLGEMRENLQCFALAKKLGMTNTQLLRMQIRMRLERRSSLHRKIPFTSLHTIAQESLHPGEGHI